ncbi:hypothetical protein [Actinorugispora endophytica]|uniref:Uncharacterized protein n=1 Tax=Actinorugispora endophytica TaxID=1605990 RepID=A0A4R6V800_9ACTN|nr:hypothetical protein [Actinorugispora endophytica]TDQ55392.1 hypothetical protein EV190_101719 [Actinorugispora endophytica]
MNSDSGASSGGRDASTARARGRGVRVRVASEDWGSITYEAVSTGPDGTAVVQRYRCVLPRTLALRRLRLTYVVGLWHSTGKAVCNHVRRVIPPVLSAADEAARQDVALVAAALVEAERRPVCGATVENLTVYTVQRAQDWQSF